VRSYPIIASCEAKIASPSLHAFRAPKLQHCSVLRLHPTRLKHWLVVLKELPVKLKFLH